MGGGSAESTKSALKPVATSVAATMNARVSPESMARRNAVVGKRRATSVWNGLGSSTEKLAAPEAKTRSRNARVASSR